jgi:hypothetical protein
VKGEGEGAIMIKFFTHMYENRTMKYTESDFKRGRGEERAIQG